jgi:hypothetical protein
MDEQLLDRYGYIPSADRGERWVIYRNDLIVIRPGYPPKVYEPGCRGRGYELRPRSCES